MSPDGFAKPPPEEKLLKLIRGKPARPATDAAAFRHPGPLLTASTQAARALVLRPSARTLRWPTITTWGLAVLLSIEVLVLIAQAFRPLSPLRLPVEAAVERPPVPSVTPELPSLSASVSQTVFSPPAAASAAAPAVAAAASTSGSVRSLAARLTLMGIVAGDSPQAIIEDAETKKTFFVTTGQMVVDGAVVKQVLDNRVVLEVDGEKIELSL